MWDHFRPVHLWVNAHVVVGNLLAIVFLHSYKSRVLVFTGRTGMFSVFDWAAQHLFVCSPLASGEKKYWAEGTGKVSIHPYFSGSLTHRPVLRLCNTVAVLGNGILEASRGKEGCLEA